MKRRIVCLILVLLILPFSCFAESVSSGDSLSDLKSKSFEELTDMKERIDYEYYSRSESEPIVLCAGNYTVGIDLPEGQYYINLTIPIPYYNTFLKLFSDVDSYASVKGEPFFECEFTYRDKEITRKLENGNYICVEGSDLVFSHTSIPEEMYYKYNPPKGTLVPIGKYHVGEDLPEGEYYINPATTIPGLFTVYRNMEDAEEAIKNREHYWTWSGYSRNVKDCDRYMMVVCDEPVDNVMVFLHEGEVVVISGTDVIMRKAKKIKLNFD